eukprot:7357733-Prymnesium_polylepis.1
MAAVSLGVKAGTCAVWETHERWLRVPRVPRISATRGTRRQSRPLHGSTACGEQGCRERDKAWCRRARSRPTTVKPKQSTRDAGRVPLSRGAGAPSTPLHRPDRSPPPAATSCATRRELRMCEAESVLLRLWAGGHTSR